jgi:phosphate-selective porin
MGQFKSQFGLELTTACSGLYSVNRSRVVNELASPFRDQGIIFLGGTGEKKFLGLENENIIEWRLALTNGQGMNAFDGNSSKDFTGRIILNPFEGIALGGSYRYGKQKPIQTGLVDDTRRRYGFDISINKYNFLLQGEYINGFDKGSSLVGGGCGSTPTIQKGNFNKDGYWLALMYTFNEKLAPIIKYQTYNVTSNVASLKDQTQQEYIVGLNYYFNDWTRLQFNYVITKDNLIENSPEYTKNYLVFQIQAKFN